MNFRDEYKKSAESASPDREAIDRMKAAVMAKLADEQGSFPDVPQAPEEEANSTSNSQASGRKPLPLKRISIIGGAVAACAVITVSAVTLLPSLKNTNGMVNTATSSAAMDEAVAGDTAGGANGADGASSANDLGNNEAAVNTPEFADAAEAADDDIAEIAEVVEADEADAAEEPGIGGSTDKVSDISDAGNTVITSAPEVEPALPETAYTTTNNDGNPGAPQTLPDTSYDIPEDAAYGTYEEYVEDDDEVIFPDTGADEPYTDQNKENPGNAGTLTPITEEAAETAEASDESGGNPMTGAPDYDFPEETMEMDSVSEEVALETEEAEIEEYVPKLILSDKGWLTYNGNRYDLDSSVTTAMFPLSPVTAANILDGKDYYLYIDGYVLKVFDGQKNFLGLYRRRV